MVEWEEQMVAAAVAVVVVGVGKSWGVQHEEAVVEATVESLPWVIVEGAEASRDEPSTASWVAVEEAAVEELRQPQNSRMVEHCPWMACLPISIHAVFRRLCQTAVLVVLVLVDSEVEAAAAVVEVGEEPNSSYTV